MGKRPALRRQWILLRESPHTFNNARSSFGCRFAGSTSDVIQRFIYVFGVWEPSITVWMSQQLQPGDVMVDVGANIGYYSLLAAKLTGNEGKVIAFEPLPPIATMLRENARRNRLGIDLREQVVSSTPGLKIIYEEIAGNVGHSNTFGGENLASYGLVDAVRGDDAIADELWPRIRVVKIDVEGDELHVLYGMQRMLSCLSSSSSVVVEVTPADLKSRGHSVADLMSFMRDLDFIPWSIHNSYSVDDYAYGNIHEPIRLYKDPSCKTDVIFVKGRGGLVG